MSKLKYVGDQIECHTCAYGTSPNSSTLYCDYIGREKHSRIFDEKGKQRLPKGYCDKWSERQEGRHYKGQF